MQGGWGGGATTTVVASPRPLLSSTRNYLPARGSPRGRAKTLRHIDPRAAFCDTLRQCPLPPRYVRRATLTHCAPLSSQAFVVLTMKLIVCCQ